MSGKIVIITVVLLFTGLAQAKECIPTPHRTTGTHYAPVTVEKTDISKGVIFKGRVLNTECQPVIHAKVAHWQAGKDGRYHDRLRAFLYTDDAGVFKFETEWPKLKPPHIHFIVTAESYEVLETQWIGDSPKTHIEFVLVLEAK